MIFFTSANRGHYVRHMAGQAKRSEFGKRVAMARAKAEMSQTELGQAMGRQHVWVHQLEFGKREPSDVDIALIARACDVPEALLTEPLENIGKPDDPTQLDRIEELLLRIAERLEADRPTLEPLEGGADRGQRTEAQEDTLRKGRQVVHRANQESARTRQGSKPAKGQGQ
jgi:transcriptional regulator with XRE-family HTH domain